KPIHRVPGGDIAGVVESVGADVTEFMPGDEVFGDIGGCGFGAFAEYVSVPESVLAHKPANCSFESAAAVPQAAVVALQGLRDHGQLQSGQSVLINGASGGVGTFAVQIAKAFGARVTGVCGSENLELVRSIGADQVIDYRKQDFTEMEETYDVIFDIVANRSISAYMARLNPQGHYVACAFNPSSLFFSGLISKKNGRQASSLAHKPNTNDLRFIAGLLAAGKLEPVIDREFALEEIPAAIHHLEGKHHGKVIITINGRG
ncbi:MAG: NAD(P)-dependent alcohol dehydrogenase, partial [Anaerolineaceae bacterium]|nr:NAD(P)-dependent alcohol dehydrogenase [Anaerolineaceae bacterium]